MHGSEITPKSSFLSISRHRHGLPALHVAWNREWHRKARFSATAVSGKPPQQLWPVKQERFSESRNSFYRPRCHWWMPQGKSTSQGRLFPFPRCASPTFDFCRSTPNFPSSPPRHDTGLTPWHLDRFHPSRTRTDANGRYSALKCCPSPASDPMNIPRRVPQHNQPGVTTSPPMAAPERRLIPATRATP